MAGGHAELLRHVGRLWDLGTFAGLTDAQLLARFADRHEDGAELAFEALVERHGPMVFRVCRGVLRDEHAAEDAFQATFLVLARKARSLWVKDSLASWLHGVAHRVAARARSDAARRRRYERRLAEVRRPDGEIQPDHPRSEAWAILSEEIARLPETYRAPVVLCYLEAMSYQATAASLGVSEDTVRGRLARARDRLRKSLVRRGIEIPSVVAATQPATPVVAVRPGLVQATARAAIGLSTGGSVGVGAISRSVISLSERTCRTMFLTKLKAAAAALMLGVTAAGAIVSAQPPGGGRAEPSGPSKTDTQPPKAVPGKGGNFIVDWIPADGQGGKREVTVDPRRHCIHVPWVSQKRDDRPNDGAVRIELERGKFYKITASGAAFMSEQTGADADPFPGVVVLYPTDEEDCYANRHIVLAPGKSISFRSPWLINPKDDVFLMAVFLDTYTGGTKRGSYTLTVEETGEQAVEEQTIKEHVIRAPFDFIITGRIQDIQKKRSDAPKDSAAPPPTGGESRRNPKSSEEVKAVRE
jgi:RNA polymerase sigma factor (sigma-70 family)